MELDEALRRRVEQSLSGSDWSLIEFHPDPGAIRLWLYSIHLVRGPRLGAQLNAAIYRDMNSGTGLFKQIDESGKHPNELLGSLISLYDEASDSPQRKELTQPFVIALSAFARSTRTWSVMPGLNEVEGIHFVVTDWTTAEDQIVLRPMMLFSEGVPARDEIIEGMAAQLAMHLARFPAELPKEFVAGKA